MKTPEEKAREFSKQNVVLENRDKFSDESDLRTAEYLSYKSYLAGYQEAMRWRNVEDELPPIGQEVLCKNKDYKQVVICDGMQKDYRWLKAFFTHWRPIE